MMRRRKQLKKLKEKHNGSNSTTDVQIVLAPDSLNVFVSISNFRKQNIRSWISGRKSKLRVMESKNYVSLTKWMLEKNNLMLYGKLFLGEEEFYTALQILEKPKPHVQSVQNLLIRGK